MLIFLDFLFCSKIVELEEELRVVGNNLKSLEVSEEKVNNSFPIPSGRDLSHLEARNLTMAILSQQLILNLQTFVYFIEIVIGVPLISIGVGQSTRGGVQEPNQDLDHPSEGGI